MENDKRPDDRNARVYIDGCFDMVHFGHANAMRQAKALGKYLVVGVHSDADITVNKGAPAYPEEERYKLIRAIKWVDELVEASPYFYDVSFLDKIGCDFVAHGDDISHSIVTGGDAYITQKQSGRYREFRRTNGVSTTDIIGRILRMTKEHHQPNQEESITKEEAGAIGQGPDAKSPYTTVTHFIPTSNRIYQFSNGVEPKPGDKIVYTAGSFDLLHAGHVDFLEEAAKQGDYLIVGVHTDQVVNKYKGSNHPIMNLHERVMSVLSIKYVSEVVIGASYTLSKLMMAQFKIDVVVHGQTPILPEDGHDPYEEARERGIFKVINSGNTLSTNDIIQRIVEYRLQFEERNKKKEAAEIEHINQQVAAMDAVHGLECREG
ncbi:ethanolamine-phosphate cytidylyltransferase-like [Lineus longissimus]|uniref:ethanolamine-phosphate cytidylyltransferase-like n=1 Tax=Lineus longissimus TaxID=88925 RepID=UPI00315D868B